MMRSVRAQGGIEANLLLLAVVGLSMFMALVITLFVVQSSLVRSQERLAKVTLPTEQALGLLESSVGALFQRQAQVSSTLNTDQLNSLRDRRALEATLRAEVAEVGGRIAHHTQEGSAEHQAQARLVRDADEFLASDAALFQAVSRKHALSAQFEWDLSRIDTGLRGVMEAAQSTAGVLQLDFVLALRRVAAGLASGQAATSDVREIVLGDSRAQLDDVNGLVQGILSVGWLAGKTGLAKNTDSINSIAGNELPQARSKVRSLIVQMKARTVNDRVVRERVESFERRFEEIAGRIAEDRLGSKSLVSLRRDILQEVANADTIREKCLVTARGLTRDVATLHESAAAVALQSLSSAETTSWASRFASILVALLGVGGCVFAGRRIGQSVRDLRATNRELTELKDSLQHMNANLEALVAQRTVALTKRDRAMQVVLDSMREGLLSTDLNGVILSERSRAVTAWFGDPGDQPVHVWDYLFRNNAAAAGDFQRGFSQVAEDILLFEMSADQLARRVVHDGRSFDLEYRQVFEEERFVAVLVVISDVTTQLEAERAKQEAREKQELMMAFLRDKRGFQQSVQECQALLRIVTHEKDLLLVSRALHTLKGNAAVMGLARMASHCHALESRLQQGVSECSAAQAELLETCWSDGLESVADFLDGASGRLEIEASELTALIEGLRAGCDRAQLMSLVETWRFEATSGPLRRLGAQATRIAAQLGKSIEVEIDHHRTRVPPGILDDFWANAVHAIRNAVDHGIEPTRERIASGKGPAGKVRLSARHDEHNDFLVEVDDDGRGIDWEQIRAIATRWGLPHTSETDLIEALFKDGLTTTTEATEISGRGIGTAALRDSCRQLGGAVEVQSVQGKGTRFLFRFPPAVFHAQGSFPNGRLIPLPARAIT